MENPRQGFRIREPEGTARPQGFRVVAVGLVREMDYPVDDVAAVLGVGEMGCVGWGVGRLRGKGRGWLCGGGGGKLELVVGGA